MLRPALLRPALQVSNKFSTDFYNKPISPYNQHSPYFNRSEPIKNSTNGPYSHPVTRGFGMALGPGMFAGVLANFFTIYSFLFIADILERDKASKVPGKKGLDILKESPEFGPPLALVEGLLSGAFDFGVKGPYSFGNEYPDYSPKVHFCAKLEQPSQLYI